MDYFLAPFRALGFLRSNRYLWRYTAAPLAITLVIVGLSLHYILRFAREMVLEMFAGTGVFTMILSGIITLVLVIVAFYVFVFLLNLFSGPFNELLAARLLAASESKRDQEQPLPWRALVREYKRTIVAEVVRAGFFVGVSLLVFVLSFAFPPLSFLGALAALFFLVFEFTDYALELQQHTFIEKLSFVWRHAMPLTFYGLGLSLFLAIPILNLLFIPAAVVSGTRLVLQLQRRT